jgi:hypothetical protein
VTTRKPTPDTQYRQGDVYIDATQHRPAAARPIPRDNGRIVLAYGEVTGHSHAIAESNATLYHDPDTNRRFLEVLAGAGYHHVWRCADATGSTVYIPHTENPDTYRPPLTLIAEDWVEGVTLRHEEHKPFVIPVGTHETSQQREYTPDAVRNVAD